MASPATDAGRHAHQQRPHASGPAPEAAVRGAQRWIEAVTGRSFGEKDFRGGLENGILLCELLSSVKPGLVKKINRLATPIAGLDNVTLFLRGCEELGLKGSQLFDPGDLQDTPTPANRGSDCNRRLKNVLITIYWLGKAANSCASYSGPTLDLKEFEGLLSQMRKEAEDSDSPKRNIRDSGYIDCWDSERSDSLSPPRHGREDSFDSLDSFGSRSRQTPSPDVLAARGSSDGRGSDSESDFPHRKLPDVRKDDMLARRTSVSELRTALPFNQYLPNKSNQSGYDPAALRRKRVERDDGSRKSWSTATSPIGGERPFRFSHSASVSDDAESVSMIDMRYEEEVFLHPHSQVRHELMHNQYNQMKEEEDHWQDDLARWKSRRRSVSQDLIKKEEERKTMERLMSGEGGISQRRKSIKTYREILEEKEHRERELYNAYHRARTPEEAHEVLQRYAQRFSISESVMETLKLPKLLERSVSADPMAARLHDSATSPSPSSSSNPMQYLRQQSLPAPKFTSTVEAMVSGFPRERRQSPSPERPPKAAPLLTPKPDSQDHNTHPGGKPVKGDGLVRVNGESVHNFSGRGIEREEERMKERRKESSSPSPEFLPCPDSPESTAPASLHSTHKPDNGPSSRTDPAPPASTLSPEVEQHTHSRSLAKEPSETQELQEGSRTTERLRAEPPLAPAHSTTAATEFTPKADHVPERVHVTTVSPEPHNHTDAISPTAASACHTPSPVTMDTTTGQPIAGRVSGHLNGLDSAEVTDPTTKCAGLCSAARQPPASSKPELRREFFASPETARKEQSEVPPTVLNLVKQAEHWSWDPDEERRRQQRWQQEQERRLQEKYRREQEKLQQEWERAQREVEEEERKYHEQEQRILEETLAPLTPHSPALHPRHKPSAGDPALPAAPQDDGTRTLGSWELKQEKKLRGEWNQRGNDGSDVGPEEGRLPPAESTDLLSSGWSEPSSHSQHYSQKVAGEMGQARDAEDSTWSGKQKKRDPSQRRRSESGEDTPQSPSCPPDTPPPSPSRSVSGKKLCSSCGHPLGKGAAMIIETLSLYFHIQCFKCGICKGQLGDTTTGTDVRIRNGLLNCHQCYIRSRSAGQPTTL
ncbi:LIM and calponin homology domains-containing protein 1 isoform X12 [Denticeps clupeoides]|uniref:LIM and calponin homology domains-containing protein 1 n=1 Tax=Denticeps clupeoides TaxID=299321 RepID=A0AAY4BNI3_9TELE|nr:LIM and calponin homology domains-containing protein 1 isoform X12 [Denticeps clupeoides]